MTEFQQSEGDIVGFINSTGTYFITQPHYEDFYSRRLKRADPMKAALRKIALNQRKIRKQSELTIMGTDEEDEDDLTPQMSSEENLQLQRAAKRPRNLYKAPEVVEPRKTSKKPVTHLPPKQTRAAAKKGKKNSSA